MYKLTFDKKALQKPCQPIESVEEGMEIAKELLKKLKELGGIGLAANQVGINKRVCVVNALKPIYLINPEIVGNILVKADNFNEPQIFNSGKSVLECVCVQHEIDHLDGITMFERQYMIKN